MGRSNKGGWAKQLDESVRIEQLDNDGYDDDDDDHGARPVGLPFDPNRSGNREMRMLGPLDYESRACRKGTYDFYDEEEEEFSSDDDQDEYGLVDRDPNSTMSYAIQLARRDKQLQLVDRALGKIRRAQMQGQIKVKLSQRELDALEEKRKLDGNLNGSQRTVVKDHPTNEVKPKIAGKQPPNVSPPKAYPELRRTMPGAYSSATESPGHFSPTPGRPSSSSSQKPRSRAPSTPSSMMQQHPGTPPRSHQQQQIYQRSLPFTVPKDQTVRPGSSYQPAPPQLSSGPHRSPRSRSVSTTFSYPMHHHSPYQTYPPASIDPRYSYSTHPHRDMMPPPIGAYQPVYRSVSGDSYMLDHLPYPPSDPFVVQHASHQCESPRSMQRSSESSSSDNGVQVDMIESPMAPSGYELRKSSGGYGLCRTLLRKRRAR
ncbi:hypothetical protein PABG_11329 [Paracoccidioides brasiliensis Pb03]|nr:hypothetical protein PABG_11329 [Paracoccidioides brasiliensis Pb03]